MGDIRNLFQAAVNNRTLLSLAASGKETLENKRRQKIGRLLGFERVPAAAGLGCVWIVDLESFAHHCFYVVNFRPINVLCTLLVD